MFMSALWDTIFEMNDRHSSMEVFLIENHIPALLYGNADSPTVYLAGFGSEEWQTSMMILKFFDNMLSDIENNFGMAGVKVKNAMRERGMIIVPTVCPRRMKYEGDCVSATDLLPIAKYLRFNKASMVFALKNDGASIAYSDSLKAGASKPDTIGKILSACSKFPIDKETQNEQIKFCRWVNEVIGIPAFTLSLDKLCASSAESDYKRFEETFLVTALL